MPPTLLRYALFSLLLLTAVGCRQEADVVITQPGRHWVKQTVAVVAPLDEASVKSRLERTAGWFLQNFREAQKTDTLAIDLTLEWYDENSQDLAALSKQLAARSDIVAVVGPFGSDAVATFAPACQEVLKPLIAPTITSEDIVRRYAVKSVNGLKKERPFLWALTEADVTLTETLMSTYATLCQSFPSITPEAFLFSPADSYGQTFNYWAPFFATNYGLRLALNEQYTDIDQIGKKINTLLKSKDAQPSSYDKSAFFCVLKTTRQLYELARLRRQLIAEIYKDHFPNISDPESQSLDRLWQLFVSSFRTYVACEGLSEEQLDSLGQRGKTMLQGYQGFSPYADPTTGFELSYRQRFGVLPLFAECKFYDALMLAAFAAFYIEHRPPSEARPTVNEAIIQLTSGYTSMESTGSVWNTTAMQLYLHDLEHGVLPPLIGASGDIAFDDVSYTTVAPTTYVRWQIIDGQILHRSYYGAGGRRTEDAEAAWEYLYDQKKAAADYDQQTAAASEISYGSLEGQYAVLVQGSQEFIDIRHQGDVLSVYQLLRMYGYPDDHIILVTDKASATDKQNSEPGIVRAYSYGPDLLAGTDGLPPAIVDYDNADLTPADIKDILLGNASSRLPTVVPRHAGQNVFLYWSGHGHSQPHGGADEFAWRHFPSGHGFTASMLGETAAHMLDGGCRKLLVVAEPCYGEVVVNAIKGINGALAICGASENEQSLADNWSNGSEVWLSDRFTMNFVQALSFTSNIAWRQLFLYCAEHTLGSHAKIVNAAHFGNLATTTPEEFIVYKKKAAEQPKR